MVVEHGKSIVLSEKNTWMQRWRTLQAIIIEVYRSFGEDRVPLAAGAISFFTLLSIVPLLLLAVTFAAREFNSQLATLETTLGPTLFEALQVQVLDVVKNKGLSNTFAFVLAFWSGSQVFIILESAMNLAWHAQRKRPFWLRRGMAMLMVVISGLLMAGAIFLANFVRFLGGHAGVPWMITVIVTIVIPALLVSVLFGVIFRILPTKPVTVRSVIPGAFIAGGLWMVSLHVFGWYLTKYEPYTRVYGSLAQFILLLIWFYYSAFILLLGAEISAAYHRLLVESGDRDERLVEESDEDIDGITMAHSVMHGDKHSEKVAVFE